MQAFVGGLLLALGGLFLLVFTVVLLTKGWRGAREGYERRRRALLLPSIVAYANAASGPITDFVPTPLKRWERRVVEWLLLDHIRSLKGHAQARLALAFEQLGFVAQAHRQLTQRRWWERVDGAEKLGRMLARSAVPDLIRLTEDPVPEVRLRAAKALGAIGGLEAVETLIRALTATDRWATLRIADILAGLGLRPSTHCWRPFRGFPLPPGCPPSTSWGVSALTSRFRSCAGSWPTRTRTREPAPPIPWG